MSLFIFGGRSNPRLTKEICSHLETSPGKITISNFADGEIFVQLGENVRGGDVFIIQSLSGPVNDHLMELLIMIDAAKRSSATRVTAVIPYLGYSRQDRKDRPRVPITAKLVANLLTSAGADRILSIDMHTGQLQGFYDIPVDHLIAAPIIIPYLRAHGNRNLIVIAPDAGSAERASLYASHLQCPMGIIDKRRDRAQNNVSRSFHVIGDVSGKRALLVDDMIDTGGTICNGAQALLDSGVTEVSVVATHGLFSNDAVSKLTSVFGNRIIVTNTIENNALVTKLSVGALLGDAISCIHSEKSVSSLLDIKGDLL